MIIYYNKVPNLTSFISICFFYFHPPFFLLQNYFPIHLILFSGPTNFMTSPSHENSYHDVYIFMKVFTGRWKKLLRCAELKIPEFVFHPAERKQKACEVINSIHNTTVIYHWRNACKECIEYSYSFQKDTFVLILMSMRHALEKPLS